METKLDEIKVSTEENNIKKAVVELQPIKESNEKVINENIGSILNQKMAEDLKQRGVAKRDGIRR